MGEYDITKTGPLSYKESQDLNDETQFGEENNKMTEGQELLNWFRGAKKHVTESPVSYMSYDDLPEDFGYSKYDRQIPYSKFDDYKDWRGQQQSTALKWVNGLGKGLALAGTTFFDGTVGLIYGATKTMEEGRIAALWDNEVSNALQQFNKSMEKWLPNYRTDAEQERPWYQNLGTANFWADSFLKNMGFTVGAFYSGNTWLGALKGIKALKMGVSAAEAAANNSGVGAQMLGSFLSGFNEARIEANNNSTDFKELETQKIEDAYQQHLQRISSLPEEEQGYALQMLEEQKKEALKNVQDRADAMGLADLIGNTVLLTASNMWEFGKLYSRGFNNAKTLFERIKAGLQMANSLVNKQVTEEGIKYSAKEFGQGIIKGFSNAAAEGFEEMNQKWIATSSGMKRSADSPDAYYKALIDPKSRDEMMHTNSSLVKGFVDTYGNKDNWEEFAIGFVTGALGMPTAGRVNNSSASTYLGRGKMIGLSGGIIGEIISAKEKNKQASAYAEKMNTLMNKIAKQEDYFVQSKAFTDEMDGFAEEGNKFEWNNYNDNDVFAATSAFANAGRMDDLMEIVDQDYENMSREELKSIAINTTPNLKLNDDGSEVTKDEAGNILQGGWRDPATGKLYTSTEEGTEIMRQKLINKRDQTKQAIKDYVQAVEVTRARANGSLNDSEIEELAWLNWKVKRLKDRYGSLLSNDVNKEFINQTATALDNTIAQINRIQEIDKELGLQEGETSKERNRRLMSMGHRNPLRKEREELLNQGVNGLDLSTKEGQTIFNAINVLSDYFHALQAGKTPEELGIILDSNKKITEILQNDELVSTIMKTISGTDNDTYTNAITDLQDVAKIGVAVRSFSDRYAEFMENPLSQKRNRKKLDDEAKKKQDLKEVVKTSSEIDSMEVKDVAKMLKEGKQISKEVLDKLDDAAKEKIRKAQETVDAYTQRIKDIQEAEVSPEVRAAAIAQVEASFDNSNSKEELLNLEAAAFVDDLLVANTVYNDGQQITPERQEAVEKILDEANELQRNLNIQDEKRRSTKIPENIDEIIEEAQNAETEDAPSAGNDANAENNSDEASFKAEQEDIDNNKVEEIKSNILDDFENTYAIELNLRLNDASKQALLNNLRNVLNQVENLAQQDFSFMDVIKEIAQTPQGTSVLSYLNNPAYKGITLEDLYEAAKNTKEESKKPKSEKKAEVEKKPEEYLPVIDEEESESETQKENNFYSTTKDPDDKPKNNDPFQYWRSNTPEYVYIYVDGEKVNGKVERKRIPIKYDVYLQGKSEEEAPYKNRDLAVYDYFVKNGVFERRNSGGIKEGDTIYYITDPELNEKAGEVVILMAVKNKENNYDIIGDVGSKLTNTGSQIGLTDFILRFEDAYSRAGESTGKWVYKDETTTIKKILVGTVLYSADDKTLNTVFGDNDFEIGIITDSTTHQVKMSPNKTMSNKERSILAPLSGKRGQAVVLIPTHNNGKRKAYITVRFTPQRFDIEKHKNTQYYKALEQAITNIVKAKGFKAGGNTAKDNLMDLLSLPDNISLTWRNGKLTSFVLHSSNEAEKVQLINKGDKFNSDEELVQHLMEQISNADILIQVSNKYINNNRPFKVGSETIDYNRMIGEVSTANLGNDGHIVNNWFFSSYKEEKDSEELFDPSLSPTLNYNDVETAHGKRGTREEPINDKEKPKPAPKPKPETPKRTKNTTPKETENKEEENDEVADEVSEGVKSGKINTKKNKERTAEKANAEFEELFAGKKARLVWDKLTLPQQNKILNISDMSQQQSCMSMLSSAVAPKGFIPSKLGNKSVDEIIDSFDDDSNRKDIGHLRKADKNYQERADLIREKRIIERSLPQLNRKEVIRLHKGLLKITNSSDPLYAWGKFQDGIIALSDEAARGTLYHESFHFVFNSLLTDDEIVKIYDAAKEIYGDKSYLALEEDLAEDFRRYMQFQEELEIAKESGNIQEWNKIKSEIKSLLNKLNGKTHILNNLFSDIYNRKYAERVVNNRNAAQIVTEREMQEIRQDAIARDNIVLKPDGSFDYAKAPNGNRSNLNERQWLQVRTKTFKRWFGDWESVAPKAENSNDTVGGSPVALSYLLEGGPTTIQSTGYLIHGISAAFELITSEIEAIRSKYLGQIDETPSNFINDKTGALQEIKELIDNTYGQQGLNILNNILNNATGFYAREGNKIQNRLNELNNTIRNAKSKNVSKVVDENGEPLVVYRNAEKRFSIERPNTFFTDNREYAEGFDYGVTSEYFLNIRNPEDLSGRDNDGFPSKIGLDSGVANNILKNNPNIDGIVGHDSPLDVEHINWTGKEYVIRDPNQIKSATDNVGTFSEDDNIRYRKTVNGDMSNIYEDKLEAYESNKLSYEELSEEDKNLLKDVGIDENSWLELTKEEKENTKRCLL